MEQDHPRRRSVGVVAMLAVVGVAGVWVLYSVEAKPRQLKSTSEVALRSPSGQPQLVSIESRLAGMDGQMCNWAPASASLSLAAALQEKQSAASSGSPGVDVGTSSAVVDRRPVRVIRDTDPIYSSVAVDTRFNEVILQDANLFGIKVFDRLDNTPAGAKFTEPKRVIEGNKTKLAFNCGLYVDPRTGDIYSVEQDTGDRMVVFPHEAKGNVAPARELKVPHRGYAIAVNEEKQELYLTIEYPPKVVVYRKTANGGEKPIRILEGKHTRLADAHGIALDVKNDLMFVSNHGSDSDYRVPGSGMFHPPSITAYPLDASGDTPPLRVIEGPKTRLNWPAAMSIDPERGELYVANDIGDSILVFRITDSGDVAPTRMLKGPKTGLKNPSGIFADTKNQELWVSNLGNHSATVYPFGADGDIAPRRTIRSAAEGKLSLKFGKPGAVGYDSKREQILVPN